MKKLITLLLAMTLVLSLAACGGGKTGEPVKDDTEGKTAVDILNDAWAVYEEAEKFPIAGGDYTTMVSDAPGAVDVTDGETLDALLGPPPVMALTKRNAILMVEITKKVRVVRILFQISGSVIWKN